MFGKYLIRGEHQGRYNKVCFRGFIHRKSGIFVDNFFLSLSNFVDDRVEVHSDSDRISFSGSGIFVVIVVVGVDFVQTCLKAAFERFWDDPFCVVDVKTTEEFVQHSFPSILGIHDDHIALFHVPLFMSQQRIGSEKFCLVFIIFVVINVIIFAFIRIVDRQG